MTPKLRDRATGGCALIRGRPP